MSERMVFSEREVVSAGERELLMRQRGCVVWFTGLSGSGKSTLAGALERTLVHHGRMAYRLDGDNLRQGLCRDLGFSVEDRRENIRRVAEVARLLADAAVIGITAFISPSRAARAAARDVIGAERFMEVYVATPIAVCEQRDVKGLYARARAGDVPNFTGVSAPYEEPERPDLRIDTSVLSLDACVSSLLRLLERRGFIPSGDVMAGDL